MRISWPHGRACVGGKVGCSRRWLDGGRGIGGIRPEGGEGWVGSPLIAWRLKSLRNSSAPSPFGLPAKKHLR